MTATGVDWLIAFVVVTVVTLLLFWIAGKFFPGKWLD